VQRRFTVAQPCLNLRHEQSRCTAASQAACCYHFIPSAHTQHQQAPAAGGQGWGRRVVVFAVKQVHAAVKSAVNGPLPVVLHMHSAGLLGQRRLLAVPDFSWKSSRSHSREFGNGK